MSIRFSDQLNTDWNGPKKTEQSLLPLPWRCTPTLCSPYRLCGRIVQRVLKAMWGTDTAWSANCRLFCARWNGEVLADKRMPVDVPRSKENGAQSAQPSALTERPIARLAALSSQIFCAYVDPQRLFRRVRPFPNHPVTRNLIKAPCSWLSSSARPLLPDGWQPGEARQHNSRG